MKPSWRPGLSLYLSISSAPTGDRNHFQQIRSYSPDICPWSTVRKTARLNTRIVCRVERWKRWCNRLHQRAGEGYSPWSPARLLSLPSLQQLTPFCLSYGRFSSRRSTPYDARREGDMIAVSYTHLTLPTIERCRSRWSPYH